MLDYSADRDFFTRKTHIRLLLIIDAADSAGITPLPTKTLHLIAYLANVLSPLWNIPVDDGKLLRSKAGPFYPDMQHEIDRLVGMGLLTIASLRYEQTSKNEWRFDGSYWPNVKLVLPILGVAKRFTDELELYRFCKEIALSLSLVEDDDIAFLNKEDATYADPHTDFNNVIDFAEWTKRNTSTSAAELLGANLVTGCETNRAEKLHAYVQYAARRAHGRA